MRWVGKDRTATERGRAWITGPGNFPLPQMAAARALGETTGFVKILADAKTDRILGVHIIGPMASELIQQAVLALGVLCQ
ncbi:MAG: hypothetical protein WDM70_00765 [Nitrosomonadales bacterium]